MVCAVVADTRTHAKQGAAAVKIKYEDLPDPIFTVEVCQCLVDLFKVFNSLPVLMVVVLPVTGSHREVILL